MIAVVGAGVTGLCLSHALSARGVEHVVLEAADRPGGVIRSLTTHGLILEAGPQRMRLTPDLVNLIASLGIEDQVLQAEPGLPLFVYRDGRLRPVPFSFAELVRTDLLSPPAKLRALCEPFTSPARPDESVANFFRRRFGDEAYLHLLGPLFGGLYASDPADMLVRHALAPLLRELRAHRSIVLRLIRRGLSSTTVAAAASFRNGMQVLTDGLYHAVSERVRLNTPVRAVTARGEGYSLELDNENLHARQVVITCAAQAAAGLLQSVMRDAAALAGLHYNHFAMVFLQSDCNLRGMGYQTSLGERLETRGVTFNHALFGETRRAVNTVFVGGARNPDAVGRSDQQLGELAAAEFRMVTNCTGELLHVERVSVPAWDRSWSVLDGVRPPPGLHFCANWLSRIGIPGRLAAARRLAAQL
jgi:oxygen-dependent protoporphyrinogen oxidase